MKHLAMASLVCLSACIPSTESAHEASSKSLLQKRELVSVEGLASDFNIETFRAISCAGYGKYLGGDKRIDITNKHILMQISQRLEQLQAAPASYGVDVRARAILHYNDRSRDTLCLGNFFNHYRGHVVLADTVLSRLLGLSHQRPFLK
jgi:hypothetical protein